MRRYLPLLLCLLMLLCGCSADPLAQRATGDRQQIPAPVVSPLPVSQDTATLWFRFDGEPVLAAETRLISHSSTESYALSLLRTLLEGPSAAYGELSTLFPQGTQVISATQADRVMFVTLSRQLMNAFPDEPALWREDPYWAQEIPLRRQLAMQSIAATLTENCAVDTVVILVDQSGTDSLRLRQGYYTLDGSMALAAPLTRDESLLLSPARAAEIILQCWQEEDFRRLYRYIARIDPLTGDEKPDEARFIDMMHSSRHLLQASASGGSVSLDGRQAVFSVSGAWLQDGSASPFSGMVLHLTREDGIWRAGFSHFTAAEVQP